MNFFSDYPDIISEALIPMIIAIFAFGFPLLIQTVSRIDDKYKSTKLIETFIKDGISQWFLVTLVSSIVSYIIWFCQIPTLDNWGWFVDNSALIFVTISTVALILATFGVVYLTYIYYVPELLLNRLIGKYDETRNGNRKKLYLQAISKILNYSIETIDEPLADKLWEFYFSQIIKLRKNKENSPIIYPREYYETFLEANEILCEKNKKAISRFNNNTIFDLFFDGYQQTALSQETYSFLWKLILQSLHYNRQDFVLSYWRKAHQLFILFMPNIHPEYDSTYQIVKNQDEIEQRESDRKVFLEFNYALGGLLMYKQQYKTLKELMYFTQSQPPKYVLVPERMQQVIERYVQIDETEYYNPVYYEQRYWFPDIYGVNTDETIRMWIKRYLAILFIRQYTLHEYYVNSNTLTMPPPPEGLSELNKWKEKLDNLEYFIKDYLSQKDVLEALGLAEFYNATWFEANSKEKPFTLIGNFREKIEEKYRKIKEEQPIDNNKEKEFQEATIKKLKPLFEDYIKLFTNSKIGSDYKSYFIGGQHYILEKTAFAKNQDIGYVNSDSITSESVATQFQYYALNAFILIFPQKYFLTEKDVFLAIDGLGVDAERFVIVSVGLNFRYFSHLQIDGLQKEDDKWFYNKIEIIEVNNYVNDLVSQSLFILKKEDIPNIIFKELDEQFVKKYSLVKIDETFNIYTGLIDLNNPENEIIKQVVEKDNNQADLSKSVLACVDINVEIQCKQNAKCIQLKAFSQFDDRGKANRIEDVKSLWK